MNTRDNYAFIVATVYIGLAMWTFKPSPTSESLQTVEELLDETLNTEMPESPRGENHSPEIELFEEHKFPIDPKIRSNTDQLTLQEFSHEKQKVREIEKQQKA